MNLKLIRLIAGPDGILSVLEDENGVEICETIEHAYPSGLTGWVPKIPNGTFTCVRGPHRLHSMTEDFTTFEVTEVPGHTGVLFHCGNTENDSEGCVLLGEYAGDSKSLVIINSRLAFEKFMNLQDSITEFELTVEGP